MMVLGEIGGIYGAIVGIPSMFISYFVQKEFMRAVAKLMPIKDEQNSAPSANDPLKDKLLELEKTSALPGKLDRSDAQRLADEASKIKTMPDVSGVCSKSSALLQEAQ